MCAAEAISDHTVCTAMHTVTISEYFRVIVERASKVSSYLVLICICVGSVPEYFGIPVCFGKNNTERT